MQGIYKISCTQENIVYIGSSVDIDRRWKEHVYHLNKEKHTNKKLQEDWDAYGSESFIFEIIERTSELVKKEQCWLDKVWPTCYNTSKNAWNPQRDKKTVEKGKQTTFDRYGTRSTGGKFTQDQVITIINLLNEGKDCKDIAKTYKVHYSSIYYIRGGQNWSQLHHLINLPKKPREIAFEYLEQGYSRQKIYELFEGKQYPATIWNWEKAFKSKGLKD